MHRKWTLVVLAAAALVPSIASAQQPQQQQPTPQSTGIVVVSQQKCAFDKLDDASQFWKITGGPLLDDLVRQGRLTGWGVLEHVWGDEWNQVIYYTAPNLNTFTAAFNEFFGKLMQKEPGLMQRFAGWCTEHRDNIYRVVTTNTAQPPLNILNSWPRA